MDKQILRKMKFKINILIFLKTGGEKILWIEKLLL